MPDTRDTWGTTRFVEPTDLRHDMHVNIVTLEPGVAQRLLKNAQTQMERMAAQGHQPVVLCSSKVRLVFRRLLERKFPQMGVLAYNEIVPPQTEVQALGTLSVGG